MSATTQSVIAIVISSISIMVISVIGLIARAKFREMKAAAKARRRAADNPDHREEWRP